MKSKRFLSLTLVLTMISANAVFADQVLSSKRNYAQDKTVINPVTGEITYESLTIDQAVDKALAYSHTIKTLDENAEKIDDNLETASRAFYYLGIDNSTDTTATNNSLAYSIRYLNNTLRSLNANKEIAKQGIRLSIENVFNSIKAAEEDINLYEENLIIQDKNIKIAEVKKNLGLISQIEYDNTVTQYKTLETEKQNLEISLDNTYRSLNKIMGTDLEKRYDIVFEDEEYTVMPNTDVTMAIERALTSTEKIKAAKDALDLANYDYNVYTHTSSTAYDASQQGTYKTKKNTISQASRDLDDARTSLRTSMTSIYDNIITLEQSYIDTQNTLNLLKSQYEVVKAQYDIGKATEIDVLTVEYNIHKAEAGLDKIVRNHNILVKQFNNPDLIQ